MRRPEPTGDVSHGLPTGQNGASHDRIEGWLGLPPVQGEAAYELDCGRFCDESEAVVFQLVSPFGPAGDQPQAIEALTRGLHEKKKFQTLMGVTGSGKTFTMANVIQQTQRPALVLSHNKTLSAQLYSEFREFFPHNAVAYFVSYYDYYQPEAYIPQRDIYIEKDASINEEIDRLRLAATSALMSRRDVIIVASVSCIYGLGSPDDYREMMVALRTGQEVERDRMLARLVDIQYERNDVAFERGKFRVRGDCVEVFPSYEEFGVRIEFWGDEVEQLSVINPTSGEVLSRQEELFIYPAKHFVLPDERVKHAVEDIHKELAERLDLLRKQGKLLEAQRLSARTRFDLEMLQEVGYCPGDGELQPPRLERPPGRGPARHAVQLLSRTTSCCSSTSRMWPCRRIGGMYRGRPQAARSTLVEHGFRLPSALDNRPLGVRGVGEQRINQVVFVSATPGRVRAGDRSKRLRDCRADQPAYRTARPGHRDRSPAQQGRFPHLVDQIHQRTAENGERDAGHHVDQAAGRRPVGLSRPAERSPASGCTASWTPSSGSSCCAISARAGSTPWSASTCLREGLDLPEVSLVAILDADKEGFLRSETSLMQTIGRSARNVNAKVILYADKMTDSMQRAIEETRRRRAMQQAYNEEHGITPETIRKSIRAGIEAEAAAHARSNAAVGRDDDAQYITEEYLNDLEQEMLAAAEALEFERAAALRDRIEQMRGQIGKRTDEAEIDHATRSHRGRRRKKTSGKRIPKPGKP